MRSWRYFRFCYDFDKFADRITDNNESAEMQIRGANYHLVGTKFILLFLSHEETNSEIILELLYIKP
jgi:hypothetical protein